MLQKMQQSHFVKKYSVQFVNASGKLSAPFYFHDNKPHECSQTWQVIRSEFDQMMLENAREHGVDAHEGRARARGAVRGRPRRRRRRSRTAAATRDIRAKVVVDASGQAALLQNRFKLRVWDPILNKGAIWTYWRGAYRDTGRDEGATMVLQTDNRNGWFWYIPQHDDTVSVGIVAPFDYLFKGRGTNHEKTYLEEVDHCPAVKQRIAGATRTTGYFVTRDYSYRSTRVAGRRLGARRRRVRLSRSAVFVRRAARAQVRRARRRRDRRRAVERTTSAKRSSDGGARTFNQGVDRMRRLVCEFYDGFSFGQFVRKYPHLRGTVTDLLIGDLFNTRVDAVWGPMESLYKPGKTPIPPWDAGTPGALVEERAPHLELPEGQRR